MESLRNYAKRNNGNTETLGNSETPNGGNFGESLRNYANRDAAGFAPAADSRLFESHETERNRDDAPNASPETARFNREDFVARIRREIFFARIEREISEETRKLRENRLPKTARRGLSRDKADAQGDGADDLQSDPEWMEVLAERERLDQDRRAFEREQKELAELFQKHRERWEADLRNPPVIQGLDWDSLDEPEKMEIIDTLRDFWGELYDA